MKNMIKYILLVLISGSSLTLNAQIVSIKGGFNLSIISDTDLVYDTGEVQSFYSLPGFHLGTNFEIPLGETFALETGVILTTKGLKTELNDTYGNYYKERYGLLFLQLPLSFKSNFSINDNLDICISAGNYFGLGLIAAYRSEFKYENNPIKEENALEYINAAISERFDYGLTFGAGIEIKGIIIGASYDLSLFSPVYDSLNKNHVLKFSLGYRFGWDN